MHKVLSLYEKLLSDYGPQGWWPIIKKGKMVYHPGDYETPRTENERFQIVIGAILAQNTNWKNAEKALLSLYSKKMLSRGALSKIPVEKIASAIRSSGYYNQKARRIKNMLSVYDRLKKFRESDEAGEMRKILLATKGIGPETADSILLYAFKKPIFVVDAYTRRFCERNRLGVFKNYEDYRLFFEKNLPRDHKIYNEYHALIVQWGKEH